MLGFFIIFLILSSGYDGNLRKVEEELKETEKKMETIKREEGSILKEIERIEREAEKERKRLSELSRREKSLKKRIGILSKEGLSIQGEIDRNIDKIERGLFLLYRELERPRSNDIVLCRESEEKAFYIRELIKYLISSTDTLSRTSDSILMNKNVAQKDLDELLVLKREKRASRNKILARKREKEKILERVKTEKGALERLRAELEASRKELEEMIKRMAKGRRALIPGEFTWPVDGKVVSKFGTVIDPVHGTKLLNKGIGIRAKEGERVVASAKGRVVYADRFHGYGKTIIIDHENGYHTVYSHLLNIRVVHGEKVEQGELIGNVGTLGMVREPTLHFEVRREGRAIDPLTLLVSGE